MEGKIHERMPLVRLAVCLMAGIVVGEHLSGQLPWLLVLAGMVGGTLLLWRYEHWQSLAIALCFVVLGIVLITRQPEPPPHGKAESHRFSRVERTRLRCLQWRQQLLARYEAQGLEGEQYAVVAAMTLGDKSALTKDVREVYAVTGAAHVLALSGLHLGIIYALLSLLVVGRRWQMLSQLVCILGIWAFAFLVGLSASVVRSAIMLTVYALLSLGHRDKMSLNTLAFTAILMLVVSPRSLFDIGFQLSFMAVASILLWLPVFRGAFSEAYLMEHPLLKWVWSMAGVSLAAQGSADCLLLWAFLYLFPPDELHCGACCYADSLSVAGGAAHPRPRVPTYMYSQTAEYLFGLYRYDSWGEHRGAAPHYNTNHDDLRDHRGCLSVSAQASPFVTCSLTSVRYH